MLTYENVLNVFADYLARDVDCEVILTRHGYTFMEWEPYRNIWSTAEPCPTPESLRDILLNAYQMFREMEIADGERELTAEEKCRITSEVLELKEKCEKEASSCSY